ncbi:hypothetical protein H5410_002150 [Solanum commersonii]|uniref:Uncharacterized protein n=1 Tax=Solanum commersonii TaxID=4109 RepID=A0A9J6B160_SOLCO|nr:hypothetical protein H5410_002150 [Solanum commersonii]
MNLLRTIHSLLFKQNIILHSHIYVSRKSKSAQHASSLNVIMCSPLFASNIFLINKSTINSTLVPQYTSS